MIHSAFSSSYESRSPFSPKYKGRDNGFSRNAHRSERIAITYRTSECEIYVEIQKKNEELLEGVKSNLESFIKKSGNKIAKKKFLESSEEKLKRMYSNIEGLNISFKNYYADERRQIVADINEANEIVEKLKK